MIKIIDKEKEERRNRLYQDYAQTMADGKLSIGNANTGRATITTINNLFRNPEENYSEIGTYMNSLYKENGTISGTIKYLQSHIPYNHYIYPTVNEKSTFNVGGSMEEYMGVANFIESYRIKFFAPYFVKQTLIHGVSYFYKVSNAKGIAFMEFPSSMCRVYAHSDGVYRWEIEVSKLNGATGLPNEIQKAIEDGAPKGTELEGDKRWSPDGKFFRVSDKGVAFSLDHSVMSSGATVSELANVLTDALRVKAEKSNVEIRSTLDTIKIIHSKIPIDKDGTPTMPAKTAKIYDSALKRSLPAGITGITSPLDINAVNLTGGGDSKVYDSLDKSQEQLFLSAGTSSQLFGDKTSSSNVVKLSIQKDANWIYTKVLPLLQNYYNYELSKYKSESSMVWKVGFIEQSNFSMKDDTLIFEKQLQQGGSRLRYLASTGMTPVEVYGLLMMEQQMLDIDSIMIPKATSFNTSGSAGVGEVGRPKTDNPTDDTDRINDAQ